MTGESRERPGWSADARTPLRPGSLLPQLAAVVVPLIVHRHIGPNQQVWAAREDGNVMGLS